MKMSMTPPCTKCGKRWKLGNTNGMPNMVGFGLDDGRVINICQECMIELGKLDEQGKDKFFEDMGVERK